MGRCSEVSPGPYPKETSVTHYVNLNPLVTLTYDSKSQESPMTIIVLQISLCKTQGQNMFQTALRYFCYSRVKSPLLYLM